MKSEHIKAVRKRLGLTQERLAEIVGVSVHAVRKWEQGKRNPGGAAQMSIARISKEILAKT